MDHLRAKYLGKGKPFFKTLEKLFNIPDRSVRDVVLLLNIYTFRRNSNQGKVYLMRTLIKSDIDKALADVSDLSKTDAWDLDRMEKDTLIAYGMTFHKSGLLMTGQYDDSGFPGFTDEEGLDTVGVYQKELGDSGSGGLEEETGGGAAPEGKEADDGDSEEAGGLPAGG